MFDPNLTEQSAYAEISDVIPGASVRSSIDTEIISLCKRASTLRNHCFASQENYSKTYGELQEMIDEFHKRLVDWKPFKFICENFEVYRDGAEIPDDLAQRVYYATRISLIETISNAMVASNDVEVTIDLTRRGILMITNQGSGPFDENLLPLMRGKADEMCKMLRNGIALNRIVSEVKTALRSVIGFISPNFGPMDGLPYRGNGTTNILINNLFRTNFISSEKGNLILTLHAAHRMRQTFSSSAGLIEFYRPSPKPVNTRIADEVFGDNAMEDWLQ